MAGTTNDDELLILSDDDSDTGTEFVLEEQIIDDNKSNSNNSELISFDSELPSFDISFNNEDVKDSSLLDSDQDQDQDQDGIILSFDEAETKDKVETQNIGLNTEVIEESALEGNIFSLGQDELVENTDTVTLPEKVEHNDLFSQELSSNTSDTISVGTMSDILDETIAKFTMREEAIASSIALREEHIRSLKEQILSLESAVNTDNEEVARLNTEKQSIVKNRKSLEKMKETPVSQPK